MACRCTRSGHRGWRWWEGWLHSGRRSADGGSGLRRGLPGRRGCCCCPVGSAEQAMVSEMAMATNRNEIVLRPQSPWSMWCSRLIPGDEQAGVREVVVRYLLLHHHYAASWGESNRRALPGRCLEVCIFRKPGATCSAEAGKHIQQPWRCTSWVKEF